MGYLFTTNPTPSKSEATRSTRSQDLVIGLATGSSRIGWNRRKCTQTIDTVRELLETDIPILGICLGMQILALAAGADTYKLKFGHRAVNHPCLDVQTGRCYITTQNHGYSVSSESLAETKFSARFVNINDKTIEGISHEEKSIIGVQWHPESSPGPYDTRFLFDQFMEGAPTF